MATTITSGKAGKIEQQGIEIIADSERIAKPRDLFWPWFAANISVLAISYGNWILGFGINFWQATFVSVLGIVISFALCGVIAIAGKRGSAPTMVLSRAAFGVNGQKIPGVISWLVSIGWETILAILAVLATATVFTQLGVQDDFVVKILATVLIATLIVVASVMGYHTIMRLQTVITWATGAATLIFMILVIPHINFDAVFSVEPGTLQQTIGALVMVLTGFGLGWINIAADWSRYQKREASGGKIVFWNTLGGSAAPVLLVIVGLLLAASDENLLEKVGADPIGALITLLPGWALIPFWLTAVFALVSGAVLGIYSSGLTLLSMGIKLARPVAAGLDGLILSCGTVFVVFFAPNFIDPFQSFLITLGVPLAAWAGIMIADIARRKTSYDEAALFDANGRYGAYDWISLSTFAVSLFVGWGLVVNSYSTGAAWNNWQGYLLEPLGLGSYVAAEGYWDGSWAYANLGVLFALVFSFLVTFVARKAKIRRQEAQS